MPPNIQEVNDDDLSQLELKLKGLPITDYLSVFIQDPQNPQQYWFRKIFVENILVGVRKTKRDHFADKRLPYEELPYEFKTIIEIRTLDLDLMNDVPYPITELNSSIEHIKQLEENLIVDKDYYTRKTHAVIGVAEYKGNNSLTLNDIIALVAFKYDRMRNTCLN